MTAVAVQSGTSDYLNGVLAASRRLRFCNRFVGRRRRAAHGNRCPASAFPLQASPHRRSASPRPDALRSGKLTTFQARRLLSIRSR